MKRIPSAKGFEIIVDDEDYDRLAAHKWYPVARPGNERPARRVRKKTVYLYHEVIGRPPAGMVTDHINGDPWDNRKCNLRFCTHAENIRNQRRKPKSGGVGKGVHLGKAAWFSSIQAGGRSYHLGSYKTALEAELAYDGAALFLHGEFACLNHPDAGTAPKSPDEFGVKRRPYRPRRQARGA